MSVSETQNVNIISTATIAADLHRIMLIAWSVSIAAKNAMIIAAQAGEKAIGFQPITRFIDDIARTTISSTEQVEKESVRLTRLSASYLRTLDACKRFNRVVSKAEGARFLDSFNGISESCQGKREEQIEQVFNQLSRLSNYMLELQQDMRAALAVASVCRIEASRAGEYRENLSVVADDLERAARNIQNLISDGLERISRLNQLK